MERHEAVVDVDGETRTVSLAVLTLDGQTVATGEWVLVHTGFAMEVLDAALASELVDLHRKVAAIGETGRSQRAEGASDGPS